MEYGLIFHVTRIGNNFREYGQIFHVMRIGKYYCKNMKYRINIYIYILDTSPDHFNPARAAHAG